MRPGVGQLDVATDEYLQFAAQLGATDVLLNTPKVPGAQRCELVDLIKLRLRVGQYGLKPRSRMCLRISTTRSR
jgi:mannonate dehydratase